MRHIQRISLKSNKAVADIVAEETAKPESRPRSRADGTAGRQHECEGGRKFPRNGSPARPAATSSTTSPERATWQRGSDANSGCNVQLATRSEKGDSTCPCNSYHCNLTPGEPRMRAPHASQSGLGER